MQVSDEFEKQWEGGNFPGWPKETSGALAHTGAYLDLSAFSSAEELASLGLDRLKSALMALNLKCGGYVKAHFVTTAHYVTTRAFRNKISAHFVTTRIS